MHQYRWTNVACISDRRHAYGATHRERVNRRRTNQDRSDSTQTQAKEPDTVGVRNDDTIDRPAIMKQKYSTIR
jgi:hypothetical protein